MYIVPFPKDTLPSLAMRIFKAKFMPDNTIYQLNGQVEQDIRQAYTGGHVDVYIPHNSTTQGSLLFEGYHPLYYYDANSLYAFIMSTLYIPVGRPVAFEGNIRSIDKKAYGFFYCKIISPDYLEHPILQRKVQTKDGIRTVLVFGMVGYSPKKWTMPQDLDINLK